MYVMSKAYIKSIVNFIYAGTLILGDQVSGKIIESNIINYVIKYDQD